MRNLGSSTPLTHCKEKVLTLVSAFFDVLMWLIINQMDVVLGLGISNDDHQKKFLVLSRKSNIQNCTGIIKKSPF